MKEQFEAGQLHKFINKWHVITSGLFILDMVEHCHLNIDEANIGYLFREDIQYVFSEEDKLIMH